MACWGWTGNAVSVAIRADPALRAVSLVALAGYAGPRGYREGKGRWFDHPLAKPLDIAALDSVRVDYGRSRPLKGDS